MFKTKPDIYLKVGVIGIVINLVILFFTLYGRFTPDNLKGVTGWQGDRGFKGRKGIQGVRGLRGKKGGRGNDGNYGSIGLQGAYSGNSAGKRIYCHSDNCFKKNSTYHGRTELTEGARIWPSDECINAGNFENDILSHHNIDDHFEHNMKCGYNWIWSDRQNSKSCVKDVGADLYRDGNVRWINGEVSESCPTLASIKGGYGVSTNNSKCKNECPECPGKNTRKKFCGNLSDYSRPARVEGTCQRETLEDLSGNSLIFCCNQDGSDIEKNMGTACNPKITEYCKNEKNKEECRKNMGFSGEAKFRDTINLNDRRCKLDKDNYLPGGDKKIRNWCVGTWGCCRALTGVRRMRH